MLLAFCERLFSNEIEQHAFEDQMRAAFGTKVCNAAIWEETLSYEPNLWFKDAYKIFTIDKVIGVIIKQVGVVFLCHYPLSWFLVFSLI